MTVTERTDSRQWRDGQVELRYTVEGTSDDAVAIAAVMAAAPAVYVDPVTLWDLVREDRPQMEAVHQDSTGNDDGVWIATLRYRRPELQEQTPSEIGTVRIRGSTKGGSEHIVASRATVGAYGAGADVGDNGNLVNVQGDSVGGLDITVPVFRFTVTKVHAGNALPSLGTIYALSGQVNNASFTVTDTVTGLTITLAADECLFLGADFGEARADGGVEFSYDFAASPNVTGRAIGGITGIAKKGWEYVWVESEQTEIAGPPPRTRLKSVRAYVERVYERGTFSGLGL